MNENHLDVYPKTGSGILALAATTVVLVGVTLFLSLRSVHLLSKVYIPSFEAVHDVTKSLALMRLDLSSANKEGDSCHINNALLSARRLLEYSNGRLLNHPSLSTFHENARTIHDGVDSLRIMVRRMVETGAVDTDTGFHRAYNRLLERATHQESILRSEIRRETEFEFAAILILTVVSLLVLAASIALILRHSTLRRRLHDELSATNRNLDTANRQLTAHEQQLRATNQQLLASEQQLRATNQQLVASEQQLRAANQQLRAGEQTLRQEAAFRESIINNAADGIAVCSNSTEYPYVEFSVWNTRMVEITGYSMEQINAVGWYQSLYPDPEVREKASARMDRMRQGDNLVGEEWTITCRDGSKRIVAISTAVVSTGNARTHVLAVIHDLTEKKRAEEELRNIQRLESLGVLAGGIAHDFNNLLAGLFGFLDMARRYGRADEETMGYLDQAISAFHKARNLTQQLLTFAKGGAPVTKVCSAETIVADAVSLSLSGSNIRCTVDREERLWNARVDEHQIGQVIGNLLINARQAMAGGGVVNVRMRNCTVEANHRLPLEPGPYVQIQIQDHGIGIPADHLSRIFDPFFTTKQQGSGLGLATSHSIVRRHGGHISVESEIGTGTMFRVYLPAVQESVSAAQTPQDSVPRGSGRILVMDDEKLVRDMASLALRGLGYQVETAGDGQEAVEKFRRMADSGTPFDLVILDLTVSGGMGGMEALRLLKNGSPDVKAIVSSGYSEDPILASPREYGFCGIAPKPYRLHELARVVFDAMADNQLKDRSS